MKKFNFILHILAFTVVFLTIYEICSVSKKYKSLNVNQETLLDSLSRYKVLDSLNTVKINMLTLSTKNYEKYFSENAKIVKKTKADKVESIINPKILTEIEIRTVLDTVYIDSTRHFKYADEWSSVNGIVYNDSVSLNIKNTEELIVVTSKQKKKFLFFKLPICIFGYKNKQVDVISKNPRTTISNVSYVNID